MLAQTILISAMLATLLAGLFFNYRAASDLKADIGRLDDKLDGVQSGLRVEINGVQTNLRTEMKALEVSLRADIAKLECKIDGVQADLRQFYHLTGTLEGRVGALERRVA